MADAELTVSVRIKGRSVNKREIDDLLGVSGEYRATGDSAVPSMPQEWDVWSCEISAFETDEKTDENWTETIAFLETHREQLKGLARNPELEVLLWISVITDWAQSGFDGDPRLTKALADAGLSFTVSVLSDGDVPGFPPDAVEPERGAATLDD
jgi:hypothetical protein